MRSLPDGPFAFGPRATVGPRPSFASWVSNAPDVHGLNRRSGLRYNVSTPSEEETR
jgi:hypothetical protein